MPHVLIEKANDFGEFYYITLTEDIGFDEYKRTYKGKDTLIAYVVIKDTMDEDDFEEIFGDLYLNYNALAVITTMDMIKKEHPKSYDKASQGLAHFINSLKMSVVMMEMEVFGHGTSNRPTYS